MIVDWPRREHPRSIARRVAVAMLALAALAAAEHPGQYARLPSKPGDRCIVCDARIDDRGLSIIYEGRRVPLADEEMLAAFLESPGRYFHKLQPRGALFDERQLLRSGLRVGWLVFGLWVLTAILSGALCYSLALRRELPGAPWFLRGLALNAIGILLVLRADPSESVELPPALAKVPVTAAPIPCPGCDTLNHPSARICLGCGASLTPRAVSDVDRLPGF